MRRNFHSPFLAALGFQRRRQRIVGAFHRALSTVKSLVNNGVQAARLSGVGAQCAFRCWSVARGWRFRFSR